jgi:hypothetical protein
MGKPKGSPKTGGRQKGTPNRADVVRSQFFDALEAAGGQLLIQQTAVKDPGVFLKIVAGLLPKEVDANISGKITVEWQGPEE